MKSSLILFQKIIQYLLLKLMRGVVRVYQILFSPNLAPRCRYIPTCSQYALEALEQHGAFKGSYLSFKRLGRCHPWGGYGYDPVPPKPLSYRAFLPYQGKKLPYVYYFR